MLVKINSFIKTGCNAPQLDSNFILKVYISSMEIDIVDHFSLKNAVLINLIQKHMLNSLIFF